MHVYNKLMNKIKILSFISKTGIQLCFSLIVKLMRSVIFSIKLLCMYVCMLDSKAVA